LSVVTSWIAALSQGAKTDDNCETCCDTCQSTAQCHADTGGDPVLLVRPGIPRLESEGLDPQLARLLFDQGNFAFANAWVMLASLSLATGVVSIRTGALPRWLSWAGVLIAGGLLAARAIWASSGLVFVPFGLCYLWLIAISIVLIGRARAVENPQRAAQGLSVP